MLQPCGAIPMSAARHGERRIMATASVNDQALADALDSLATDIERNAGTVIGASINVSAQRGFSGTLIGEQVSVSAGAGAGGTIIGKQISVSATGDMRGNDMKFAEEIRTIAAQARAGSVELGIVKSVIQKAASLGNAVLTAVTRGTVEAAIHHYGV